MRGRRTTATPSVPPTPRPAAPLPQAMRSSSRACPPAIRRCCPLLASLPACPPAIRRCCPLLAPLPACPLAIRRCCPSPISLQARPPATQPLSSLLVSFQAEHPPPGGRGGLDVANQGNRGPESTRQVAPPLLCPVMVVMEAARRSVEERGASFCWHAPLPPRPSPPPVFNDRCPTSGAGHAPRADCC